MRRNLILLGTVLIFTLTTLLVTGAAVSAQDEIRIGVATPTADHGWTAGIVWWSEKAIEGMQEKYPNITFFYETSSSAAEQVSQIENLMVKGIDCLVLLAHESAPLTPVAKQVKEEGIYLVSVDRGLTEPIEDIYVAGDNPGLGRASAEYMAERLGGEGKILAMEGIPSIVNQERVEAFEAVMAQYPDIEILDSQPAYWRKETGLEIMENWLQKYRDVDAVFTQDDDVLKGALQAYKESGRDDIDFFIGGAGSKDIIKMIMDDDSSPDDMLVPADVMYPPSMIATGISMGVKAMTEGRLDAFYERSMPREIIVRSDLVTKENAEDYYYPDSPF